jgi:outer membrane protein assembly factor BamB
VTPASTNGGTNTLLASPTVVGGVVYIGAKDGEFYAVDMATQKVLWSRFLGIYCGSQGIVSTAAVANDPSTGNLTVYVNAPDGHLYALDAATGNVVWASVVDTPSQTQCDYYSWGSPLVANGKVYVGISSDFDSPLIPGGLVEFDQATGQTVATWHSLPVGQVGASVWSSPALAADGSIIVTTGNGYANSGQPLYNESIVRLDPNTLAVEDYWQVPASEQARDGDFGASPTVFTANLGGVSTPMVGACNKNGIYYAFRQNDLNAGPVWQFRMTIPYPGGAQECDGGAVWDGTTLIESGGAPSSSTEPSNSGSIVELDPATGVPVWQTHLDGTIVGSPAEDGAGVVTAPTYASDNGNLGVYLINASTGAIMGFIPTPHSPLFGQAVFVGNNLLVGAGSGLGLTDYEIMTPGPPITGVSPSGVIQGNTKTITLTGSNFSGSPLVSISGAGVSTKSVTVISPTQLTFKAVVTSGAPLGSRDISVTEPGTVPVNDTCSACFTVLASPSPPVPSSINPSSVEQGAYKAPVSMTGSNFESGAVVSSPSSGISVKTTFASSTSLSLAITVNPSVAPGTYNLVVTNPDGGVGTCSGCLTVTAAPDPSVVSVVPSAVGQSGTFPTINIYGNGFSSSSTVSFSNTGVKVKGVTFVNVNTLQVSIYVASTAQAGSVDTTVSTPSGPATCTGCLTVDPGPKPTAVSSPLVVGQTTTVTVSGSNFQAGLSVTTNISGATVSAASNVTSTSFTVSVTVPASTPPGQYTLTVKNPDGGRGSYNGLSVGS